MLRLIPSAPRSGLVSSPLARGPALRSELAALVSVLVTCLFALSATQARAESAPTGAEAAGGAAEPAVVAVAARPISEAPPEYPASARKAGREGWVIVSYVVRADGSVGDVTVEDSSGAPELAAAATAAVAAWRYAPATLNGEPTEEAHAGVLFPFAVGKARGSSSSFVKKYRRVMSKREKGDLAEAEQMTRELAADPDLNLYEAASTEILLSLLSRDQDDERGELWHLERAHVGQGAYLDDAAEESLLFRMFALQVELSEYAEALSTYDALVEARGRKRMPEPVEKIAREIRGLEKGDGDIAVPAVLGEAQQALGGRGRFDHLLLRRLVGFGSDSLEDDLDEYELRCDFHRVKGEPHANRAIRIPEAWGNCRVYVYGEPGSEFRLIEYAEPAS